MTHQITDKWNSAKHMYFSGISVRDIAEELSLDINELGYKIFGLNRAGTDEDCWYQLRNNQDPESFIPYVRAKHHIISMAEAALMKKVTESAIHIASQEENLDIDGIDTATKIVERLDKVGRLERGESTENVNIGVGVTLRDIVNGSTIDDEDIEDIDYKELPNE